ncbi:unnamed protein product [Peniophora sp. CBMAI 1063]|nr:unnamed protein product [Peniophora sp. CBMAI 1063]
MHKALAVAMTPPTPELDVFKDAAPFPTNLPTDLLLRAAVRLSNAIAAREAQVLRDQVDSPISPLTASSPDESAATCDSPPALDEISAALNGLLLAADNLRIAPDFTDGTDSSDVDVPGVDNVEAARSDSSYSDGEVNAAADSANNAPNRKRKRKRKPRKKAKANGGKTSAHNNGHDGQPNGKKADQAKKHRKKRQQDRADATDTPPYERQHSKHFYKSHHGLRLLNLRTIEVKYVTGPGGYVGKKKFGRKVYTVAQLKAMGFKELDWDGE